MSADVVRLGTTEGVARPCIAIVTLQGAATFAIHATRRIDDVITQWTTHAGDVILLRGWQPHDHTDPRPWHRVDPPIGGSRLMFQARHNLAASTPPPALLSTLTDTEVDHATQLAALPAAPRTQAAGSERRPGTTSE